MLGFRISMLVLMLHLGSGSAITLPLNLTDYASSSIASNVTGGLFPPGFHAEVSSDEGTPLNPLAMFLNAIEVMSILAVQDQRKTWRVFHWTLQEYNVWIFLTSNAASGTPSALQTRFAVWGLNYGVFSASLLRQYNPTFVELNWQGNIVGEVSIEVAPRPAPSIAATQPISSFGDSSNLLNVTEDLSSFSDLGESFRIFTSYNGATLNSESIFNSVLGAMTKSANEGADSRCPELSTGGAATVRFHIISEKDQYGNSLLRYRHVVKPLRKVAFKMVSDRKFAEMIIVLELNGVKAAEAEFKKVTAPSADVKI